MFQNTATACAFLQLMVLKLIYDSSIVNILYNRKRYVTFFNKINSTDQMVASLRREADKWEIRSLFYLRFTIVVSYVLIYFLFNLNFNSLVSLMWQICLGIQVISITLISYFIKAIAAREWNLLYLL